MRICAHPALKTELEIKWADANFVYSAAELESDGQFQSFQEGKCDVLSMPEFELMANPALSDKLCELNLVTTDSLILENVSLIVARIHDFIASIFNLLYVKRHLLFR